LALFKSLCSTPRSCRQRARGESGAERRAFDELHDDERLVIGLAHLVDSADVRVIQCGRGACLAYEPLASIRIAERRGRKHLDRHDAVELVVVSAVDLTHAAGAEPVENAVVRDARAGEDLIHQLCFHELTKLVVSGAGLGQEGGAIGRPRSGLVCDPRDLLAAIHGWAQSSAVSPWTCGSSLLLLLLLVHV
jgi:hypothetical protein